MLRPLPNGKQLFVNSQQKSCDWSLLKGWQEIVQFQPMGTRVFDRGDVDKLSYYATGIELVI